MKQLSPIVLIVISLLSCTGCATNLERAYTARTLANSAMQDAVTLRKAGTINDAAFAAIVSAADLVSPALDELDSAALENRGIDFQRIYSDLKPKLTELLKRVATARKSKGVAQWTSPHSSLCWGSPSTMFRRLAS